MSHNVFVARQFLDLKKKKAQFNFKTKHCFKIKEVLFHSETIEIKYLGSQYFFSAETTG